MLLEETRRRRPSVSLTPLIDVVFILLVFFMLASSFTQWRGLALDVPGEGALPADDRPVAVIRLAGTGETMLDGVATERQRLLERIEGRLRAAPELSVQVRADAAVPLQRIVDMLDGLRNAGAAKVTLDRGESQ